MIALSFKICLNNIWMNGTEDDATFEENDDNDEVAINIPMRKNNFKKFLENSDNDLGSKR